MDGLTPKHSANALPASPAGALISKVSMRSCQGAYDLRTLARIAAGSGAGEFGSAEPEACEAGLKSLARIASGSALESEMAELEPAESEAAESGASGTEAAEFEAVDCDGAEFGKLANSSVNRDGLSRENNFCDPACAAWGGGAVETDFASEIDFVSEGDCVAEGDDAAGDDGAFEDDCALEDDARISRSAMRSPAVREPSPK